MTHDAPTADLNRTVLVIDDNQLDRRLLRVHLKSETLELVEAADGRSGLDLARRLRPDLILLDVVLPGWDGYETIRRLKDDSLTRSIPVIFLSAKSRTVEKARGLDLGAADFISKPFDPIELRARVRAALRTKYLQDLLEERAHLDGLTGLGNRHALEDRLETEWTACSQRGCPLAILIADLDHFKAINDQFGHAAGDEILRRSALTLRSSVRSGDFVARYGGEEFIVIAPDCDLEGAVNLGERFRADLAGLKFSFEKAAVPLVTVSIGVASAFDPFACPSVELMCRADRSLYQAKAAGRNSVWAWDHALKRPAWSPTIRRAASAPPSLIAAPAQLNSCP